MNRSVHSRWCRNRGVILFIVTIVLAMVSLAAYSFVAIMQTENKAAQLYGDQLLVKSLAASAEEYVASLLELSREQRSALGGLVRNPRLFQAIPIDPPAIDRNAAWQARQRIGRIYIVSGAEDSSDPAVDFNQLVTFGVTNESSKLNLAQLISWDQQFPGSARFALLNLPGMTRELADRILDWIDRDHTTREFGAETTDYEQSQASAIPLNRLPTSLEELMMMPGISERLMWGPDTNRNFRLEYHEQHQDVMLLSGQAVARSQNSTTPHRRPLKPWPSIRNENDGLRSWSDALTLHSAERNESFSGLPRIYLNNPDLSQLHSQLAEQFSTEIANFVVAYRQYGPSDTPQVSRDQALKFDPSKPSAFQITSQLDLFDVSVTVDSTDEKHHVLASPFSRASAGSMNTLIRFCDATTLAAQRRLRGRVNVNLASREVLLGVPTMTGEIADRLIEARRTTPFGMERQSRDSMVSQTRIHAVWIFTEGLVDLQNAKRLLPFLTCGGDVVRGQVIACFDSRSPWMRSEFVIDGSMPRGRNTNGFDGQSRRLYYRDLRLLGRGFTLEQLLPDAVQSGGSASFSNELSFATR